MILAAICHANEEPTLKSENKKSKKRRKPLRLKANNPCCPQWGRKMKACSMLRLRNCLAKNILFLYSIVINHSPQWTIGSVGSPLPNQPTNPPWRIRFGCPRRRRRGRFERIGLDFQVIKGPHPSFPPFPFSLLLTGRYLSLYRQLVIKASPVPKATRLCGPFLWAFLRLHRGMHRSYHIPANQPQAWS